ncbi:MAG: TonB-dependent receptor [Candidatus Kapabacteria bacterium]|nr:TonB-dependent receptor [Candidatus Kapabacteria bacterium]
MKIIFFFIAVIITLNLLPIKAQNIKTGMISGQVLNSMNRSPLSGITVKVLGTELGAYSDIEGKFKIKDIQVGIYAVQFTGLGFEKFVESNVVVNSTSPITLEINLNEKIFRGKELIVRSSYFDKKIETMTSTQTLSTEDIRRSPGVQEDVIRATALLPGVAVTSAGRNDLVVRGGAPFENLFIVDNIEIPNINHFGSQGSSGGPLSLINIDFVRNLSFSAGGYGARYGDKLSSMTNISLRNGNEEKLTGKLNLSATGFGGNIEGPVSEHGSYWFSIRRSYLDFIFKAAGFGFIPEYWDFQGKVNYKLDNKNQLSFLTVAALDNVTLDNSNPKNRYTNSQVADPNQNQYFSGLTLQHLFDKGYMAITLGETNSKFSVRQNDSNLIEIFKNVSSEAETSLKTDINWQFSQNTELVIGNQIKYATTLKYDVYIPGYMRLDNLGKPQELKVDTSFHAIRNATYISITTGMELLRLTVGGRMDYYNFLKDNLKFSPRLSLTYTINDVSSIIFSAGRFYQSPSFIWLIGAANQDLKPIRADQIVFGYEHTPYEDLKVQVEAYYKWYGDYPGRVYRPSSVLSPSGFDDLTNDIPFGLEPLKSDATGYARGVEIFIQKKLSEIPIYGLLSLTLSESKFKSLDNSTHYGAYDSRIILNMVLGYRINSEWEASTKFRLSTGAPTTPFLSSGQRDNTQYNEGERLATFHALDIRLDKRWNFESMAIVTYIDIQDIYNRKNVSSVRWDSREQKVITNTDIGILPSIGFTVQF